MSNPIETNDEEGAQHTKGNSPYYGIPTTVEYTPYEHGVPTHLWNPKSERPERNPTHPSPLNPFYEPIDVKKSWCECCTTISAIVCIGAVFFVLVIGGIVAVQQLWKTS